MNKEFFKRVLTLPIIIGIILAVVLIIALKMNADWFIPYFDNNQYAYHDTLAEDMELKEDKNADPSTFEKNQCIGILRAGEGYPIRYDMDYSNIQTSVSFLPQSVAFGKIGVTYIYAGNSNAKEIKKESSFNISSVFGEKRYRFKNEKSFNSEYSVLNYAPDCSSSVVIYYNDSDNVGFNSKFVALVYEEV